MMNPNGKKLILWFLSLILCITACAPAFASTGDRVLLRRSDDESSFYIRSVLPYGEGGFCVFIENYPDQIVMRYTDYQAEPEKFVKKMNEEERKNWWLEGLDEDSKEEEGNDEDIFFADDVPENQDTQEYEYVNDYFGWNGEIYALMNKSSYDGETSKEELLVKHVKLEDGQIILEDENAPELDFSSLVDSESGSLRFYGTNNIVTAGDSLFMTYYAEEGERLLVFDMHGR